MNCTTYRKAFALVAASFMLTPAIRASAQTLPSGNIQRIERDQNLQQRINELEENQIKEFEEEKNKNRNQDQLHPSQDQQTFNLHSLSINGASAQGIEKLIREQSRELLASAATVQKIEQFRHWIRQLYRDHQLLAVVSIDRAELFKGHLQISITESRLGKVTVNPQIKHHLNDHRAIAMIYSAIQPGHLLRLDKLTSALLKLNDLAGVSIHSKLQRGESAGTTNILLEVKDKDRNSGFAQINNETNRFLGELESELIINTSNNVGLGESFSLDGQWWGNGQGTGNLFGSGTLILPITNDGLKLNLYGNASNYRLLQELYTDNINGSSTSLKIGLKQPLWRRPKQSLWIQLDGDYNTYIDKIDSVELRNKSSKVGRLSLISQHQDRFLGTGLNTTLLQYSYGQLDRSKNEYDFHLDGLTANTHGDFNKIFLLYNRYQIFSPKWQAKLLVQGQSGFNNLDGAEKISIGYPNGVRAYPPGEGAGDSGVSAQSEIIYRASPLLSFSAFFDAGYVWRWNTPFQGGLQPNSYGLAGPGVGVKIGRSGEWLISGTWAFPIGNNPANENYLDVDGYDSGSRLWASIKLWF